MYFPNFVTIDWWILVIWLFGLLIVAIPLVGSNNKARGGIIASILLYLLLSLIFYFSFCYYIDGRGLISVILT